MISEELLQECIDEYKAVCHRKAALFDGNGELLAASGGDASWPESLLSMEKREAFLASGGEVWAGEGFCLFRIQWDGRTNGIFLAEGTIEENRGAALMTVGCLKRIYTAAGKRKGRKQILKELLEGKLTGEEEECRSFNRFRKRGEDGWIVFLIEGNEGCEGDVEAVLSELFAFEKRAEAVKIGEGLVAFACPLPDQEETAALTISDTISGELMIKVRVAVSRKVYGLDGLSKAFKEAFAALEIGKIFYRDRQIHLFGSLGIGGLIYHLPVPVCEGFIRDIFGTDTIPEIDDELLDTAYRFLANNLNLSETGRQLYIHRNTLVYRLEKIHKETGLDIRSFDDAMAFKTGMIIGEYMKYKKQ